jgi:hypothetical protein
LLTRFRPALSPDAFELFERIVDAAVLEDSDGSLTLSFESSGDGDDEPERLCILPAREARSNYPSFRVLESASAGMEVGEVGDTGQLVLHDGTEGTLAAVGKDAWNARFSLRYSPDLWAPIDVDLQSFYVLDPAGGRLWFRDHGGPLRRVRDTSDPVLVYMREVHARLGLAGSTDRTAWLEEA